jgi:hypothetical protein
VALTTLGASAKAVVQSSANAAIKTNADFMLPHFF